MRTVNLKVQRERRNIGKEIEIWADKDNRANRASQLQQQEWLQVRRAIRISFSDFPNTIIRALLLIFPLSTWLPNRNSSSPLQGLGSCNFAWSNTTHYFPTAGSETMFWEFCTQLQNEATVGIMGPVKNRSWRASSHPSPSPRHHLVDVLLIRNPYSLFSWIPD